MFVTIYSGAFFQHCEKVFNQILSVIQSYPMDQVIPWNNIFRNITIEYFFNILTFLTFIKRDKIYVWGKKYKI